MKKKMIAIALAMVMTMGMSVTAFADPITQSGDAEMRGTAEVKTPTIKVVVPTSFVVKVNPYSIPFKIDGTEYNSQIVSPVSYIASYSDVPVVVTVTDATAKSATANAVTIVDAVANNETAKKAELQLAVKETTGYNTKTGWGVGSEAKFTAKFVPTPAAEAQSTFQTVNTGYQNYKVTLAPATSTSKIAANLTDAKCVGAEGQGPTIDSKTLIQTDVKAPVNAASGKDGLKDQETVTTTPSVIALQITGKVVAQPTKLDNDKTVPDEWNGTDDKLDIVVKYNFQAKPVGFDAAP